LIEDEICMNPLWSQKKFGARISFQSRGTLYDVLNVVKEHSLVQQSQTSGKMKILKEILGQWSIFSKTLGINSKKNLYVLMQPAIPCFQSLAARETL